MRRVLRSLPLLAAICATPALAAGPGIPTKGPDVTISNLTGVGSCSSSICTTTTTGTLENGYRAYSVGTTSCNIGDTPVNWCDEAGGCSSADVHLGSNQHPVIAQGLYRYYQGRFSQIGMSWLKHGFVSTNSNEAQCKNGVPSCISPPMGGNQLGVGCNDTYGTSLNGGRPLGMRSEVNVTTGAYPFPHSNQSFAGAIDERIKVLESDLDADFFPGARYFADAQYIADNDALYGNGLNNASYREASVNQTSFAIGLISSLVRERTAIHGWQAVDQDVEMYNADVPGAIVQRFEVARRVTQLDEDTWHYEIAIRNMNSDRSAGSFQVEFPDNTPFANIGWSGINHHSGEPYSTAAWDSSATSKTGIVSWTTASYASDVNANALRWATLFNFWFDADVAPGAETYTIGLFKPGTPESLSWTWPLFKDGFESNNYIAWEYGTE